MSRSTFGSITKRKDGRYQVRYTDTKGKRHSVYTRTKKEAEDKLADFRVNRSSVSNITIDEFVNDIWIPELNKRIELNTLSRSTLQGYLLTYRTSIKPVFGDTQLSKLKGAKVQDWLMSMTTGQAKHAKSILRVIMRRACDLDYIESHPMDKKYIMPNVYSTQRRTQQIYTYRELCDIADVSHGEVWEACYLLSAFGGGIISEVTGVKVEECQTITENDKLFFIAPINRSVHHIRATGVEVQNSTKNEYRRASIIVEEPYSKRLQSILSNAKANSDTYLTDDGFGHPVDPTAITRAYKRWFTTQPFKYLPFSNLRNAYSTSLHNRGLDAVTISKLMRHSNLQTDYIFYNRPSDEDLAHALASSS